MEEEIPKLINEENAIAKWQLILQNIPSFVAEMDLDGIVLALNKVQPGFSLKDFLGKSIFEFTPKEGLDQLKSAFSEVIEKRTTVSYDAPDYGPNKTPAWYQHQLVPVKEDGEIKSIIMIVNDITERRQMEKELKNALSEWEVTFNAAKDSTMLIDDKFKIFKANLATERFLSKHLNEILGKTCYELVHGTDKPPDICPLKMAKHTKKHEGIELYVPEKNVWLSATVDPILDDKGNLTCAVHIIKDITERKKAEGKIKQQNIRLAKLDELKTAFLNVTSHELRTPMASIKGYIQMLLRKTLGDTTDEQEKALEVVLRNANRLDHLIQDILDISRLESGTMKFIPRKTDIRIMMEETVETMQPSATSLGS